MASRKMRKMRKSKKMRKTRSKRKTQFRRKKGGYVQPDLNTDYRFAVRQDPNTVYKRII